VETHRNAKGESESKLVKKYDDKGLKTERYSYDAQGTLSSKAVFSQQADGSIIQTTDYFKKGAPDGRTIDKLDSKERFLENNHRDGSKEVNNYSADATHTQRISYDEKGRVKNRVLWDHDVGKRTVEVLFYRGDASRQWRLLHTYNDNGELVKEEFSGKAGSAAWQYEYEYDATGNWVKKTSTRLTPNATTFRSATPGVTSRAITYYEAADLAATVKDVRQPAEMAERFCEVQPCCESSRPTRRPQKKTASRAQFMSR